MVEPHNLSISKIVLGVTHTYTHTHTHIHTPLLECQECMGQGCGEQ